MACDAHPLANINRQTTLDDAAPPAQPNSDNVQEDIEEEEEFCRRQKRKYPGNDIIATQCSQITFIGGEVRQKLIALYGEQETNRQKQTHLITKYSLPQGAMLDIAKVLMEESELKKRKRDEEQRWWTVKQMWQNRKQCIRMCRAEGSQTCEEYIEFADPLSDMDEEIEDDSVTNIGPI